MLVSVAAFGGIALLSACSEPDLGPAQPDAVLVDEMAGDLSGQPPVPSDTSTAPEPVPPDIPGEIDLGGINDPNDMGSGEPGTTPGEPGLTAGTACVQKSLESTQVTRPVDIIFVVDNSISMVEEIREVEQQINQNFANIIEESGIDYRVLMLSGYGPAGPTPQSIYGYPLADGRLRPHRKYLCVTEPLGQGVDMDADGICDEADTFDPPPSPNPRFRHYPVIIESTDGPCLFLERLAGGSQRTLLATPKDPSASMGTGAFDVERVKRTFEPTLDFMRRDAWKVIVFVTDEKVRCNVGQYPFGSRLPDNAPAADLIADAKTSAELWADVLQKTAPGYFGADAANRRFAVWSIIGQAPYAPGSNPFGTPAPLAPASPQRRTRHVIRSKPHTRVSCTKR